MILTELDVYTAALKKVKLDEEVMPIYKGKLLTENVDTYCKIQRLLNCSPMETCHRWLYDLDVENLDEAECAKVNNLYKLSIEKGYIVDDKDTEEEKKTDECDVSQLPVENPVAPVEPVTPQIPQTPAAPTSAYTVVYSAMRNGEIKTGEAYSNAINTRSAKADVISKLERAGYQNISILAIEAGDPDMSGCDNTFCKQPEVQHFEPEIQVEDEENSPLVNALDDTSLDGVKVSSANVCAQDAAKITINETETDLKTAIDKANKKIKELSDSFDINEFLDNHKEQLETFKKMLGDQQGAKDLDKIIANLRASKALSKNVSEANSKSLTDNLLGVIFTILSLSKECVQTSKAKIKSILRLCASKVKPLYEADDEEKDEDKDSEDKSEDDKDSEDSDKKEEKAEEPDEKLKDTTDKEDSEEESKEDFEEKELSDQEKSQLKDSYKKAFKAAMLKCKFEDKCFDDLTLEEKVKFFTELDNAWKSKADPVKFLSDKETEQLEKIVVKK